MHPRQKWIAHWQEQNALSAQQVPAALRLAGLPPSRAEWRLWIDRLLLWLGVAALLAGLIFFVAANWSGMGRLGKFALAEAALVLCLAAYGWGARFRHGNAALLAASLAVGALLALIGQIYQTGADTFELFAVWAALILPWVLLARLPALWVVWLALLHVAYVFYMTTLGMPWWFSRKTENIFAGIVLLDCCALLAWEWLAARGWAWMQGRWVPRLLALTAGVAATLLAIYVIVDHREANGWYFLLYCAVLAGIYVGYRHVLPDLSMLAGGALSLIVVVTTGLGRLLLENQRGDFIGSLFLLGLFSMLATAGAAWWLRRVARTLKDKSGSEGSP